MSRSRALRDGKALALAAILTCATVACQATTAAAPRTSPDASSGGGAQAVQRSLGHAEARGVVADTRAAQDRGDWHAVRRFQLRLIDGLGQAAITQARAVYRRALDDLDAAGARGDAHARADFRTQLRAMCGPSGVVSAFESCDAAVITWGR
jgi:hypothetical protein